MTINAAFPRTSRSAEDCEKRWYNVLATSLKEIAVYKESMRATGTIDFNLTKLFLKYEMIVYPCNPLSEIAEMVEEILGMANPSICGIANAPDPALLKLRKLM